MADVLLNRVINDEIKVNSLLEWLLGKNEQGEFLADCSRADFLTYFLNFVHEEVPCQSRYADTPQKCPTSRAVETQKTPVKKIPLFSLPSEKQPDYSRSPNYSHSFDNSTEKSNTSQCSNVGLPHVTSTPKVYRVQPENPTNGYLSPLSPLYKAQNSFSTPKTKRHSVSLQKSGEKASPLCLGDFIVNRKPSGKKKASRSLMKEEHCDESSKRIKPTSLSQVKVNASLRKTENSFDSFQNAKEMSAEDLDSSRNFLAEERLKIMSRRNSGSNLIVSSKKFSNIVSVKTDIEPDINKVTYKEELDVLVEIYACIVRNNFVLNVNSEVYFLISLLLNKQYDFKDREGSVEDFHMGVDYLNKDEGDDVKDNVKQCCDLFETVHNVVYFAVRCLETQTEVLKCYDRSTLKLLSSNNRLRNFCVGFSEKLSRIAARKPDRVTAFGDVNFQSNICFNLDTDNRENFPNDFTFQSFRKQRDIFYETLRIWENNRSSPGWDFALSLGGKIRGLFALRSEPANFVHFCRLFKAQLMSSCGTASNHQEGLSESQLPFLSSLANVDADKLSRLRNRLVTKQASSGVNRLPAFTGHQEFYRDFIIVAGSYAFNRHLCDALITEIVELNGAGFCCTNLDDSDDVDPSIQKEYVACLRSLRVLAKFLGFVEALPYKSEGSSYAEGLLNAHVNIRKQTVPSFDIKQLLQDSVKSKNLTLSVPWMTEYIAMLDYVTLRLPYYLSVHKILFELYIKCNAHNTQYNYAKCSVQFCLGWLFELPHFPDAEYFNFCTAPLSRRETEDGNDGKPEGNDAKLKSLDEANVVDQSVLYVCCPFLEEVKRLLSSDALNSSVTVKHITPVTAVQSSREIAKKRLEQQLEEAFLNGQPVSVRKTVEFVSERVASACVKHVCGLVPSFKKTSLEEFRKFLASWKETSANASPGREKSQKVALKTKAAQSAQRSLGLLREACEKAVAGIVEEKVPLAVDGLLAVDVLPQTRDVCRSIAAKMCLDRVRQWMGSHLTAAIFAKDLDVEAQRALNFEGRPAKEKPQSKLPPGGGGGDHNESALSAFHLMERIKVTSVDVLENSTDISEEVVLDLLQRSYETLNERCDVNEFVATCICAALVDLSLLLVTRRPKLTCSPEVSSRFAEVWASRGEKTKDLFRNLFCRRNVMLFAQSGDPRRAWETYAGFVARLIGENVLSSDDFGSQCTGFFRSDRDQATLKNFAAFLAKFVGLYKTNEGDDRKFAFLLDFLSDFCSDL